MTRREGGGGSTYPHDNFSDKTGVMQDANRRNKGGGLEKFTLTPNTCGTGMGSTGEMMSNTHYVCAKGLT